MCVLPCFLCWLCLQPPLCCFLVDCCGEMCWTKIRIWRVDLVRRLPSVGSSTLKCLETLCPPLVMNFCRVQGATVGTQQVLRVRKMRTALWWGLRTEHCRKPVLALPHSSGGSGGQDAAPALSLLGSLLKMWHLCSLRQESQFAGCQGMSRSWSDHQNVTLSPRTRWSRCCLWRTGSFCSQTLAPAHQGYFNKEKIENKCFSVLWRV